MLLSSRGDKVMGLEFVGHAGVSNASFAKADNAASVQDQLDAYFAGSLTEFSLTRSGRPAGHALSAMPCGQTRSHS